MAIRTISRVSGEVLKTFDELTPEQLEEKLARAATAAESYRLTTIEQRVEWRGRPRTTWKRMRTPLVS